MSDKKIIDLDARRRDREPIVGLYDERDRHVVALWDDFEDRATEAYEWRDIESIDACIKLLQQLRETAER